MADDTGQGGGSEGEVPSRALFEWETQQSDEDQGENSSVGRQLSEWPGAPISGDEPSASDSKGPDQEAKKQRNEARRAYLEPSIEAIRKLIEQRSPEVSAGGVRQVLHAGQKQDSALRLVWKSAKELKEAAQQPVNWAVDRLFTEKAKIILAGDPKAGKTFFVCDMAVAVASGGKMLGALDVLKPGAVGIVAGEDDLGEVGRRLDRMCRAKGLKLEDLPIHFVEGYGLRLNRPRVQDLLRASIRELGLKLIILDPLARLMDGDENSKEVVAGVLNPASAIANEEGASVMFVHHLGKQSGENPRDAQSRLRGSSDIASWYSSALFVSGSIRSGRVSCEVSQRTGGGLPQSFPVYAKEKAEESVYGLGTLYLEADLSEQRQGAAPNERMVADACNAIMELVLYHGPSGVSESDIVTHLGYGRPLMFSALKKLIKELGALDVVKDETIPDRKVYVRARGWTPLGPDGRPDSDLNLGPDLATLAADPGDSWDGAPSF